MLISYLIKIILKYLNCYTGLIFNKTAKTYLLKNTY